MRMTRSARVFVVPFGVLALGRKETLANSSRAADFDVVDETERIYRKRP